MDAHNNDPISQYEARLAELESKVLRLQEERSKSSPAPAVPKNFFERYAIIGIWVLLIALFAFIDSGIYDSSRFFSWTNFSTIFGTQGVLIVLTLGLLLPLTAGDFDLSIAANMTLSSLVVAILISQGSPTLVAVVLGLLVGAAIGAANAFFIVFFRIHSLIVTLGMATFVIGIAKWISGSRTISIFGANPTLIGWVNQTRLFEVSMSFWYALILCAIIWYFLEYTTPGRRLLFVGRAREVARLAGIRVDSVRALALISSGAIAAVAGVLAVGLNGSADPSSRIGLLLPAFAAAFLGATSIVPGRFNPVGSLIGVLLLATGISGLQIFGIPNFVQDLFYGGGLILAVAASQLVRRRQPMEFGS
ncbi:ABC transporter permease [Hoeflea sp. WL0058]|uniref:ABC transporter permease n=1 Tax=Flavimaribacter sediminis TaxID=2865987 RepID=A0AAE3CYQ0_9HYPH|nr:ABC transporter permease [Flavimaribacter sediminis]MBW8635904.1 ABC transporter permease [Flavimaribacter sediminis]